MYSPPVSHTHTVYIYSGKIFVSMLWQPKQNFICFQCRKPAQMTIFPYLAEIKENPL